MKNLSTLKMKFLRCDGISDASLVYLAEGFSKLTSLSVLELDFFESGCGITMSGIENLSLNLLFLDLLSIVKLDFYCLAKRSTALDERYEGLQLLQENKLVLINKGPRSYTYD